MTQCHDNQSHTEEYSVRRSILFRSYLRTRPCRQLNYNDIRLLCRI